MVNNKTTHKSIVYKNQPKTLNLQFTFIFYSKLTKKKNTTKLKRLKHNKRKNNNKAKNNMI